MANNNMNINATVNLPDAKEVNKQIRALEKKINPVKIDTKLDDAAIKNLTGRLNTLKAAADSTGKSGKAMFQALSEGMELIASGMNTAAVVTKVASATQQAVSTVAELDAALLALKNTAKMSTSDLIDFYHSANDIAGQMGVSTKEIITQGAAWNQLGSHTANTISKITKCSSTLVTIIQRIGALSTGITGFVKNFA